jgi:hypothetical protein
MSKSPKAKSVKAKAIQVEDTKAKSTRVRDTRARVIKIRDTKIKVTEIRGILVRDTAMIPRSKPMTAVGREARIAVTLVGVGLTATATHLSKARASMLKGRRTNKTTIGVGSTQTTTPKIRG